MVKRVFLFMITNLAIVFVLTLIAGFFGIGRDGSMTGLALFAVLFGMGGSFLSLAISKWMAKRATGAQVIAQPHGAQEQWLLATVARHAQAAGIAMPEVAIFPSAAPNAFATGARKNAALVAVSSGLLETMRPDEVDGVLGHEVAHIANGDMVTLALVQGVVNTFVIFLSRVLGSVIDSALSGRRDNERGGYGIGYFVAVHVLQVVLGLLAMPIVNWFSQHREFRADLGGARFAGRERMISALRRLQSLHPEPLPGELKAFGIATDGKISRLFSTHPPLAERIERLQQANL